MSSAFELGIFALVVLGLAGDDVDESTPPAITPGQEAFTKALQRLPEWVGQDWRDALTWIAYRESRFNPRAARGVRHGAPSWAEVTIDQGEADASSAAYERASMIYEIEGAPRDHYVFGSGGDLGEIPSFALVAFKRGRVIKHDPWLVFDRDAAMVMMLAQLVRLKRYGAFTSDPRFARLRAGVRSLKAMHDDDVQTERRAEWEGDAVAAGLPASFLDQRPSELDEPDRGWWSVVEEMRAKGGAT